MPVAHTDTPGRSAGSSADPGRNAKLDPAENTKSKRKRQSQSCDACRARKVRCTRDSTDNPKHPCKHCVTLGIDCTYDYQPKKRGPPNLYLRRLQEAAAAASVASANQDNPDDAKSPPQTRHSETPTQPRLSPSSTHSSVHSPFLSPSLNISPSLSSFPFTPSTSRFSTSAEGLHYSPPSSLPTTPFGSPPSSNDHPVFSTHTSVINEDPQPYSSPAQSFGTPPAFGWARKPQALNTPAPTTIPPLSYCCQPHRLEDIATRPTIMLVISLFFDFVYPLIPSVHKPSFMRDLDARREERDPMFFALVMSTVASTLVQVPRSYLPMERHVVRDLAKKCFEAGRHVSVVSYDPPTSTLVVIRYFDSVYHFCEGQVGAQHAAFGEAVHLAVTLRMQEEASYEPLDPIESEVRRRTFWLLFGADKSTSIMLQRPICLRDEDCTVNFPREIDDEYITSEAYLPQPREKTALILGLNHISRIFALLGQILVRIRVDKSSPPQGHFATARLEEVQGIHHRILTTFSSLPDPLRLKPAHSPSYAHREPGFQQATFAEVKDFFDNPNASRENALNPYLVMQANLYVTQQLVRFVIEQYQAELLASLRGNINGRKVAEDREAVASELLNILHSIPIQSIATNGPSLVHKVRFVASTLLDTVQKAETAPASAARAHAYLWDFLSILSEIERNYMLDDDREGDTSGGTSMPL